jgi:hypothetical protein
MPQGAMVIQLGVAEILKREMPHSIERGVNIDSAGADGFKQAAQLILIHKMRDG